MIPSIVRFNPNVITSWLIALHLANLVVDREDKVMYYHKLTYSSRILSPNDYKFLSVPRKGGVKIDLELLNT